MKISSLINEKLFQSRVVDASKVFGWLCYHTYDSRRSEPGFPDLVLVRDNKVLFRELKTDKGRLTSAQKLWGDNLTEAGADYAVWRPKDMDEIAIELRRSQ